ncbi:MAG: response regulator [Chloroflexi bacterium]|nr:response regulator [Chloroflexota bacterium]
MGKILIAEDERDIRELVVFTLELLGGHTVLQAADGEEALALAQSEHPDLILLDMRMPRLGGLETCRRLKALPDVRDIPVVILSARGLDDEVQAGLDAGASAYLVKPFDTDQLVSDVEQLMAQV